MRRSHGNQKAKRLYVALNATTGTQDVSASTEPGQGDHLCPSIGPEPHLKLHLHTSCLSWSQGCEPLCCTPSCPCSPDSALVYAIRCTHHALHSLSASTCSSLNPAFLFNTLRTLELDTTPYVHRLRWSSAPARPHGLHSVAWVLQCYMLHTYI